MRKKSKGKRSTQIHKRKTSQERESCEKVSGSYFNGYNKKSIFDPLSASPTNLLKCV